MYGRSRTDWSDAAEDNFRTLLERQKRGRVIARGQGDPAAYVTSRHPDESEQLDNSAQRNNSESPADSEQLHNPEQHGRSEQSDELAQSDDAEQLISEQLNDAEHLDNPEIFNDPQYENTHIKSDVQSEYVANLYSASDPESGSESEFDEPEVADDGGRTTNHIPTPNQIANMDYRAPSYVLASDDTRSETENESDSESVDEARDVSIQGKSGEESEGTSQNLYVPPSNTGLKLQSRGMTTTQVSISTAILHPRYKERQRLHTQAQFTWKLQHGYNLAEKVGGKYLSSWKTLTKRQGEELSQLRLAIIKDLVDQRSPGHVLNGGQPASRLAINPQNELMEHNGAAAEYSRSLPRHSDTPQSNQPDERLRRLQQSHSRMQKLWKANHGYHPTQRVEDMHMPSWQALTQQQSTEIRDLQRELARNPANTGYVLGKRVRSASNPEVRPSKTARRV